MIRNWIQALLNWLRRPAQPQDAPTTGRPAVSSITGLEGRGGPSSQDGTTTDACDPRSSPEIPVPDGDQLQSPDPADTTPGDDETESPQSTETGSRSQPELSGTKSKPAWADRLPETPPDRSSESVHHSPAPSVIDGPDPTNTNSAGSTEPTLTLAPNPPKGQSNRPQTELPELPFDPTNGHIDDADRATETVPAPPETANPSNDERIESLPFGNTPDADSDGPPPNGSKKRRGERPRLRPKPPIDAPGRRGKLRGPHASSQRTPRTPRPEFVCRQNPATATWQVIVVAEDELTRVQRDSHDLTIKHGECLLESFRGVLSISHGSAQSTKLKILSDASMAIFKFAANWHGEGRRVERITSGHYIVIAPEGFTQIGHVPHESEPCDDDRYRAFFVFSRRTHSDPADPVGFAEHQLPTVASRYRLVGQSVFDCSEHGPLFGGAVPELKGLSDIPWARIGEEREAGWRGKNFSPDETTIEQVLNGRQGRFFLRVYDRTKLVDSGEFRYVRDLRGIRVNGEPFTSSQVLLPGPSGHASTRVSFIGRDDVELRPLLRLASAHATVRANSILVDPRAAGDQVACLLPTGHSSVEVVADLPRIWWRLESASDPAEWQDIPLAVKRVHFRALATSDTDICLKLPRHITRVQVGFDGEADRMYRRSGPDDSLVRIPLAHFVDYEQLDDRPHEQVTLNARIADTEFSFLHLIPDAVPTVLSFESDQRELVQGEVARLSWTTRHARTNGVAIEPEIGPVVQDGSVDVSPRCTTAYTLRLKIVGRDDATATTTVTVFPRIKGAQLGPRVKSVCGWRQGKGFSRGELELAGLDADEAVAGIGLRLDRRRSTSHPHNAKTIRELIDA